MNTHHYNLRKIISKQLDASQLAQANVSQLQTPKCDFYDKAHTNKNCTPEVESVEAQYAKFQKTNSYSNTYNLGWKHHSNGAVIRLWMLIKEFTSSASS